jgi:anti-sigma-K factor RskA
MNDFSELEAELKQLRPAAPSVELMKRVERALAEAPATVPGAGVLPKRKSSTSWFALGLGLAAAAAVLLLARVTVNHATTTKQPRVTEASPAPSETATQLVPDGVTRVVYHTRNEGLVFPRNSEQPVRRVRSLSRETLAFKDRNSGASLRVSYPTEDVRLIPVSGQ